MPNHVPHFLYTTVHTEVKVKKHVRPDSLSSLLTKVSHMRYLICEEVVGLQLILVDSLLSLIVETGRISRQKQMF